MTRRGLFLPNAERIGRRSGELHVLTGFLSRDECARLISLIRSNLRPSTTTRGKTIPATYRTSRTADLGLLEDPIIEEIDQRIASILGISPRLSEPLQGQYYLPGEEFKSHTDYFKPGELPRYARKLGQRTYTFMVYLNDCHRGGETEFTKLGVTLTPAAGTAIIWNNLRNGAPNPSMVHRAVPLQRGHKAVLTKWFRSGRKRAVFMKEENEYLPNVTATGFDVRRVPAALFRRVIDWYRSHFDEQRDEMNVRHSVKGPRRRGAPSAIIELPEALRADIASKLRPIVEEWAGTPVRPTYVYGIRIYRDQATVKPHRDRLDTHVLGVIINIDQMTKRDWPLQLQDNYYRDHEVFLRPGQMLLFEAGRLLHGRSTPLRGARYANLFCHFVPTGKRRWQPLS